MRLCNSYTGRSYKRVKMQYGQDGKYISTLWSEWDEGDNIASAGMAWGTSSGVN